MGDNFETYSKSVADCEAADQQGNEIVQRIQDILSPLFSNWKRCRLAGLSEDTPHILTKLGGPNRQQVFVGSIMDDLTNLQSSMVKYAEAIETAMAAHGRIPANERAQLRPAPWHVSGPYKMG
jgi:hypothetical protein